MGLDLKAGFLASQAVNFDNSVMSLKKSGAQTGNDSFESRLNSMKKESEGIREKDNGNGKTEKNNYSDRDKKGGNERVRDNSERDGKRTENVNEKGQNDVKTEKPENADPKEGAVKEASDNGDTGKEPAKLTDEQQQAFMQSMAEILGVAPEQVMSAYEKLGLSPEDLTNTESINKLISEVKGLNEPAELLMVPELAEMTKGIRQAAEAAVESLNQGVRGELAPVQLKQSGKGLAKEAALDEGNEQSAGKNGTASGVKLGEETAVTQPGNVRGGEAGQLGEDHNAGGQQNSSLSDDANQAPVVIRQGNETVVEVGGRTVARTAAGAGRLEAADVINQIADKMKINIGAKATEIKINLRPDELGNVTVKIATESGHVTGEIITESAKIKELVEQNIQVLKEALKEQGVDIGELSVSVDSQSENERMQQFILEQEKSKSRLNQIMQKIDGEEDGGVMPVNYVNEEDVNGSTVNFSA